MKCLVAITASLLLGLASTTAHGQENSDELLGAIAGGVIGSTIGQGDGKTIATVLGVLVGIDMARNGDQPYRSTREFKRACRKLVPETYYGNRGATDAWIEGCVDRLLREQELLERRAYSDGTKLKD